MISARIRRKDRRIGRVLLIISFLQSSRNFMALSPEEIREIAFQAQAWIP